MAKTITMEDIKAVQKILRNWREKAMLKKNKQVQKEVELVMRVIDSLYTGGKIK